MSEPKVENYILEDDEFGNLIAGNAEEAVRFVMGHIESQLQEMKDGDRITISIRRQDMTQEEIDEAPEI